MDDAAARHANPPAVLFEFDLAQLPPFNPEALAVPDGFAVQVVSAIPASDRPATYHLEQLWAMARGWIEKPRSAPANLDLHLVEDYSHPSQGFTVLLREPGGRVVGMHGAEVGAPGVADTKYLVVEPELRNMGLGRSLKAWQLHTAKDRGWRVLHSDTPGDHQAEGVRRMNAAMGGRIVEVFGE